MAQAQSLVRKDTPTQSEQTQGRDEAADWIQNNVIEEGRWPMNATEIADESGWSRTHIQQVLTHYFDDANNTGGGDAPSTADAASTSDGATTITIPEGVDRKSYLRGWLDAQDNS